MLINPSTEVKGIIYHTNYVFFLNFRTNYYFYQSPTFVTYYLKLVVKITCIFTYKKVIVL